MASCNRPRCRSIGLRNEIEAAAYLAGQIALVVSGSRQHLRAFPRLEQGSATMQNDPIARMRARAEQCRRLSDLTHDRSMAVRLRQWAVDIENDIRDLEDRLAKKGAGPA